MDGNINIKNISINIYGNELNIKSFDSKLLKDIVEYLKNHDLKTLNVEIYSNKKSLLIIKDLNLNPLVVINDIYLNVLIK